MRCFTYRVFVFSALAFLTGAAKSQAPSRVERLKTLAQSPLKGASLTEYLKLLPSNRADFEAMCTKDLDEDCSEFLLPKDVDVRAIGPAMVKLASQIQWEPDAPNYVKGHVADLCVKHPKEFETALNGANADKVFKFVNTNYTKGNAELEPCVKSLEGAGLKQLAGKARKSYK